jgi:D-serine dehydratase
MRPVDAMSIVRLNDQHAYLALAPDDPLEPGDLLACGVSHPCLAFDKWSLLPSVDDEYNVVEAIRTFF